MATTSDKYIKHPDIVCCGDIIEYTFLLCNESEDEKRDSKGRVISGGQDVKDLQGLFNHSINGNITAITVDKGSVSTDLTTWDIPILRDGEQAKAIVQFTVEDDCAEEFKVELKVACLDLCLTKKINPLTCCEVKRCTAKGELDCTKLTK